ncbi:MAG: hypothetical protein IJ285_06940 [Clostridia bacterium]|nr:hypothetical protein [Oscillospiraceae bacterium]MBQ7960937.1 hypothetical protein [Clostridia bacterium]
MINHDTVELLKECNAGIKMGVNSIDEVLDKVKDEKLKTILEKSKENHQNLGSETHEMLNKIDEEGKEPNLMAQGMSWLKTNVMLAMDHTDKVIADLITDGCDMGTKSLNKYLNQYEAASEDAKNIAKRLIKLEDDLAADIRSYL